MTHYRLTFVTDTGQRRALRIADVDPSLTPQDLQTAVDQLLAHDIMAPERGALYRLQSLKASTVSTTDLLG